MLFWGTSTVKKLSTLAVYNLIYIYVRLGRVINYSSTLPWLRVDLVTFLLKHLVSELGASQNSSKLAKFRFRQKNCHRKVIYKGEIFTCRGVMSTIRFSQFPAFWLFKQWWDPPQLHHCWDSHFVPCKISGTLAILTMVDPPNFTIVEIAILFLVQFPELWLFLQW